MRPEVQEGLADARRHRRIAETLLASGDADDVAAAGVCALRLERRVVDAGHLCAHHQMTLGDLQAGFAALHRDL